MAVAVAVGRALGGVLDLVLPPRCLGCGTGVEAQGRLCVACWKALAFIGPPQCGRCGYPLPHAGDGDPVLCPACAIEPPPYERARAALRYDDGSRRLILAFKHADRTEMAPAFGQWLARAGAELLGGAALVVPVPLHRWRLLRRGGNQAALLAHALARESGLEVVPDGLLRVRATRSQQQLSGRARQENVTAAAFRVHPRLRDRLSGGRVILVDDVLTTGATVGACVTVLRRAGVAAVDVLTLARVVRDASMPVSSPA